MELAEIKFLVTEALDIDKCKIDQAAIDTPRLYGKLLNVRCEENLALKKLHLLYNSKEVEKRLYYTGKANPEVYAKKPLDARILKTELKQVLENDMEMQELALKIGIQNEKIDLINDALKGVLQRTFLIKSIIDYEKLMNGVL